MKAAITLTLSLFFLAFLAVGGCSNNRSGDVFPQPEERHSRNGVLSTTLRAFIAENFIENMDTGELDVIYTPTYEGLLTAPTLRLKPGDSLQIDLINDFPENPDN